MLCPRIVRTGDAYRGGAASGRPWPVVGGEDEDGGVGVAGAVDGGEEEVGGGRRREGRRRQGGSSKFWQHNSAKNETART